MGRHGPFEPGSFYRTDDRTGFPQRAERTKKEWNGYLVDETVWEARQPQDLVKGVKDQQSVPDARPLPPNVFVGPTFVQLSEAAVVNQIVLDLESTAGFFDGASVSIMMDNGVNFTTTEDGPPGAGTITLADPLPYSAAGGNIVTNNSHRHGHPTPSPPPPPPALGVSITPASQTATRAGSGANAASATAAPHGGVPPYFPTWTADPGVAISSPHTASSNFTLNQTAPADVTNGIHVSVRDSATPVPATAAASASIRFVATGSAPDFTVSNTAELLTALGAVAAGQTIACEAGSYPGIGTITGLTFSPAITITSADLAHPAVLNYFEMLNCAGFTFADIDFVVLLPAFYGWKFDTCDRIVMTRVLGRSDGVVPSDYENVAGMRFFNCTNCSVAGSEYYHLNGAVQFGLGSSDFSITTTNFHDLNADAIDVGLASNGLIDANYIHDFHVTGGNHPDAVQFVDNTSDITISNNLVWRGAGDNSQGFFLGDGAHTRPTLSDNLIVGTGTSALRPINCTDVRVLRNQLVSYVGDAPTNLLVQFSDIVLLQDNITLAGALSTGGTCTHVTEIGNTINVAVTDQGAAAIAAWRLLHPTVPH